MHSKLIAVGTGMFGFGALVGWAITADRLEAKMKRNQLLLGEMLRRQGEELNRIYAEKINDNMFDPDVNFVDTPSRESLELLQDKLQNGSRTAEGLDDGVQVIVPIAENETVEDVDSENSPGENSDENEETPDTTRRNLQNLIDTYTANPDDVDTFVSRAGKTLEYDGSPPFVISRETYSWDDEEGDSYAKITLTYYSRDRILVDDDQDVIDDVENYVGWRSLAQFGGESGDPDVVFVRNRRLLTDFEVVKEADEDPPIHIRYGMSRDEFQTNKAAGVIKFRDEDRD